MEVRAFKSTLLIVLVTSYVSVDYGMLVDGDLPAGTKDDISLVLRLVARIHARQGEIENEFSLINSTMIQLTGDNVDLNNQTSVLASNVKSLASESAILKQQLKKLNQTITNLSNNQKATATDVAPLKQNVTSLVAKTDELHAKFLDFNRTLANVQAASAQKVEKLSKDMTSELASLRSENSDLKHQLAELRHNVSYLSKPSAPHGPDSGDVNVTKADVEKLKQETMLIKNEASQLLNQIIEVKGSVRALEGHHGREIMFMAMFDFDQYRVAKNTPLVFNYAPLNVGNGYNTITGKFKAPLAGVYMFFVQIQSRVEGLVYVDVVKNGHNVAEIYSALETGKRDEAGSTHVMLRLNAGDEVWVIRRGNADAYYGNYRSHFTGFLLPDQ